MPESTPPSVTGVHHFSPTVTDVEASAAWYERVFRLARVPVPFPHYGDEDGGYAVLLMDPAQGIVIGLHHHEANLGDSFTEARNGLDHIAFNVTSHGALEDWAAWLDDQGVTHTGVRDVTDPIPFSTLVFRDPDNIQLELIFMPTE